MTLSQIMALEYAGGGYFRVKAPKGDSSPTVHGPELLGIVRNLLKEQERPVSLTNSQWVDVICALGWADAKSPTYSGLAQNIESQLS